MDTADTIAAISSAVGPAGRMIVRTSGARAHAIARELVSEAALGAGTAGQCRLRCGGSIWVYSFTGPRSYPGEDLIEFPLPGTPVLARLLLDDMPPLGARPAEPGEFTARAYFNGRIDLTQAEGVAAMIGAHS